MTQHKQLAEQTAAVVPFCAECAAQQRRACVDLWLTAQSISAT
jgi:hypothetical protein